MRSIFSIKTLITCLIITAFAFTTKAFDETTAQLRLSVNGTYIAPGEIVNGTRDFSNAQFLITDYLGNALDQFEILEGNVLPMTSRSSVTGKILKTGRIDAKAVQFMEATAGDKIKCTVRTVHKETGHVNEWKFHFYRSVMPEVKFGTILKGDESISLLDVNATEKVEVTYVKRPDLADFRIRGGAISVDGVTQKGKILANGELDAAAKDILSKSAGKQVTVIVNYSHPDRSEHRSALVFTVNG